MTISTSEVAAYLDALLDVSGVPDYPNALNGLQLANRGTVSRIAACVDFSTRAVEAAIEQGADLLLVHHGMFWAGLKPFTSFAYERIRSLIENDIAVYSAHLPLDRHPMFGNNVLLSQVLGLTPNGDFASYQDVSIGLRGDAQVPTQELVEKAEAFAAEHGGRAVSTHVAPGQQTRRWAICTGAGASSETLQEAQNLAIDTLIVGEGPHHTAVEAYDIGLTVIYAGHYATETLGVNALGRHLADRFGLTSTTIHAPTGL